MLTTQKPLKRWYRDVYLRSLKWKQIRTDYMRRVGWNCENCHVRQSRIVHHLSYERIGHELPEDLMALCVDCHDKFHKWPRIAHNDNQLEFLFGRIDKKAAAQ